MGELQQRKLFNETWFNNGAVEWEKATGQWQRFLFFLFHLGKAGRALEDVGVRNNSFSLMAVKE